MATTVELNDAQVSLWQDGQRRAGSPGFALLGPNRLLLGQQAFNSWRANPRLVVNQFWQQLAPTALAQPAPGAHTQADLCFRHLEQLLAEAGEVAELQFAVPPGLQTEQLAILLGMVQPLGVVATGLVTTAVAQTASVPAAGRTVVLDLHLHRTVLTLVVADEHNEAALVEHRDLDGGRLALGQALVRAIADVFVQETRFDPQHAADTEQHLWQALPGWLAADQATLPIRLSAGNREHSLDLPRARLAAAAAPFRDALLAAVSPWLADGGRVLLTPEAALVPGLLAACQDRDWPTVTLAPGAAATGMALHQERIHCSPEQVHYTTSLPLAVDAEPAAQPASVPAADPVVAAAPMAAGGATHLVLAGRALPLADGLCLGSANLPLATAGTVGRIEHREGGPWLVPAADAAVLLNGDQVAAPVALQPGDLLQAGGTLLRLVQVVGGG